MVLAHQHPRPPLVWIVVTDVHKRTCDASCATCHFDEAEIKANGTSIARVATLYEAVVEQEVVVAEVVSVADENLRATSDGRRCNESNRI